MSEIISFAIANNLILFLFVSIGVREINDSFARTLHRPFTAPIPMTATPLTAPDIKQSTSRNKWPKPAPDRSHPYGRH